MGNYKSKNSKEKINLNHNVITENESKNEKEVINEIIIELKNLMKKNKMKFIFYVIKMN